MFALKRFLLFYSLFTPSISLATPARGRTCAPLPSDITLKHNAKLPDPFTFVDGSKVTTVEDWYECRRPELIEIFQRFQSGILPPKPDSVSGSLSTSPSDPLQSNLTVTAQHNGKSISFTASIVYPSEALTSPGSFPAIIVYRYLSISVPPGVAIVYFNNDEIAEQVGLSSRGRGKFYTLYGSSHSAGAMTAWVWGLSRLIDALEVVPTSRIDTTKLGLTGCSRNGKGVLVAGALEDRIALTIPQESGTGGAGCWRIADILPRIGLHAQTAYDLASTSVWLSKEFEKYMNRVSWLPYDHHLLAALVAPRGLLAIENSSLEFLGPRSTYGCMKTARKVFKALGVPDRMGVSQIGLHNHCGLPESQRGEFEAFVDRFLKGNESADTRDVERTDLPDNAGFRESEWVDWVVPVLG